jgi:arsenate reductase
MLTVYGIKNCDTMKKTFTWLESRGLEYVFHDYKKKGITSEKLNEWLTHFDKWQLINTKGSTWKQLSDDVKNQITSNQDAIALMKEKNSLIKRPILEVEDSLFLGFQPEEWNFKA